MILVGNQRGRAKNLAQHLLKEENEHVEVHELRGFASENLTGALNEAYAISRGTKCRQFLFSLSLNPPPQADVSTAAFESAIERVEERLGLTGQPRAIVFHEKEGRRHCHAVWSRIKADEMKAVHLPKSHRKLQDVARELYIEHGWQMPRGFMKSAERDPRNFSLSEWQQAKRAGKDAREIKAALQDCWAVSDSRQAFAAALEERGYKLARGDRRSFVAVDMHGEVYAIAKWVGIKTKSVRARLGDEDDGKLPSVVRCREEMAAQVSKRLQELKAAQDRVCALQRAKEASERQTLIARHRYERAQAKERQQARWGRETAARQARYNKGLHGLWDRLTGTHKRIKAQNQEETLTAFERDRKEKDAIIFKQLEQRRALQARLSQSRAQRRDLSGELRGDISQVEVQRQEAQRSRLAELREKSLSETWAKTTRQTESERQPRRRRGPEREM
ncbi:MAG: relaxase [Pseudomonadota bacterium]|nr:relaxase [Pseudomonadota bacterium]